jgi:primosomal replication protein N
MENRVVLTARVAEAKPLRYTPAGLPALDIVLEHESEQEQASQRRQVALALKAVAFGAEAERLAAQAVGSPVQCTGFLAPGRSGKHAVLHIQSFQLVPVS